MTILRQGRWLRISIRSAKSHMAAAALGAGWLLAGAAVAAPHNHARHSLPTPLHTTTITETRLAPHKGTPRHKADARSASPATGHGTKKGKGRTHQPEPAEALIPLYRAERRSTSRRGSEARASRRVSPRSTLATAPAPRVGRTYRDVYAAARPFAPVPAAPFAEGISHPDGEERLPMARAAATIAASAPSPLPQSQIVQGFGGEVAIASATAPDRSQQRSHLSSWNAAPVASAPEPLEEREALTEAAVSPAVLPVLYDRNGRLLMPAPLFGSHDVLVHQNLMAANDGLERIQDDADLDRLRAARLLVGFAVTEELRVNPELPPNRRVARPWTALFAADLAHAFYVRFGEPIYVTSAARTVHFQARLQRVNGNAAGTAGDAASPHLTGQAVDLGKRGMSNAELAWMRSYLLPLMQAGKIDVEEEFHQACFHISVYRSYASGRGAAPGLQQAHISAPPVARSPEQP